MKTKCIFLDIDGTLTLPGTNTPPTSALEAIRSAQARGHKVFLCTGRNPAMLAPVLAYGFEGVVAASGGYVFVGDRVLFDCPMTAEQRDTNLRLLHEQGVFLTIEAKDATWGDENLGRCLAEAGDGNSELIRWRRALEEELGIRPISEYDGRPIYKMTFICRRAEQLVPARQALESEFNYVVQEMSGYAYLNGEVINRRFDKGRGVQMIAEALHTELADTIGFGDSINDREMLETVGISVCMADGNPRLREISDMVCPAAEEDGIKKAFEKLGLI